MAYSFQEHQVKDVMIAVISDINNLTSEKKVCSWKIQATEIKLNNKETSYKSQNVPAKYFAQKVCSQLNIYQWMDTIKDLVLET